MCISRGSCICLNRRHTREKNNKNKKNCVCIYRRVARGGCGWVRWWENWRLGGGIPRAERGNEESFDDGKARSLTLGSSMPAARSASSSVCVPRCSVPRVRLFFFFSLSLSHSLYPESIKVLKINSLARGYY